MVYIAPFHDLDTGTNLHPYPHTVDMAMAALLHMLPTSTRANTRDKRLMVSLTSRFC